MRWSVMLVIASCGGTPATPIDPNAIEVLVLSNDAPVAGRDVTLISSDGMTQHVMSNGDGDAVALLGPAATQATVYSDSQSPDGKFTVQNVVPGDHVCLGCTYTTMTCPGMPQITNLARVADGWSWTISAGTYAGMAISWKPRASVPNDGGFLLSPPGNLATSTNSSLDITIELFSRSDVTTYDQLRVLSQDEWGMSPFCATTAHGT